MSLITRKRAMSKTLRGLIIAVIATAVILIGVVYPVVDWINNPPVEGIKCRSAIKLEARTEELFMGLKDFDFKKACSVIRKELPLREEYKGVQVSQMSADDFKKALERDFVELVTRAWWISGEGDRPEHLVKKIDRLFDNDNNCLVVYAAEIHPPRSYANFQGITNEQLDAALIGYTKSEVLGTPLESDMSIVEYITFSGTGGAVHLEGTINIGPGRSPAVYGIAVGFAQKGRLPKLANSIFGRDKAGDEINPDASFILIAPYDQIARLCEVENE